MVIAIFPSKDFPSKNMPAYHSSFNEGEFLSVGNIALLPLRTKVRGPAPAAPSTLEEDIVDEAISLFRANCFFRNFEIKGTADRALIYIILFISECLQKLAKAPPPNRGEAWKVLNSLSLQNFSIPGEAGFPLGAMYQPPSNRSEQDTMRQYFSQLRQEVANRLPEKVYPTENEPSKWWLMFSKRKFMNKSL